MRGVDVNVLVYAHRPEAARHVEYLGWLDVARRDDEPLGLSDAVPDAYLAALAIEQGTTWYTCDRSFARFPGLRWEHPLDG
jgi:predicted nucleic acid-binding protein